MMQHPRLAVISEMAFSLLRPYQKPLAAMKNALSEMAKDGSIAKIEKKYIGH